MGDVRRIPFSEGDVVAKKYRVERILGTGGMGVVVAAMHLQLEERVALKFLHEELLLEADTVERFVREARAAAKIKSEHVARVLDVGELESGVPFLVMEFLDGEDLGQRLERGPLPIAEAVSFVLQACDAIGEAHAANIVHRDLKPSNLFVTNRRQRTLIKVLDFGISKTTSGVNEGRLTSTQALLGSPAYMSPEQMMSPRGVDARTDIWALGVILYELITGEAPFFARSMPELVAKVLTTEPTPLASLRKEVPAALATVITKCLRKERDDRFANIAALVEDLTPFADEQVLLQARRDSGAPTPTLASAEARLPSLYDSSVSSSQNDDTATEVYEGTLHLKSGRIHEPLPTRTLRTYPPPPPRSSVDVLPERQVATIDTAAWGATRNGEVVPHPPMSNLSPKLVVGLAIGLVLATTTVLALRFSTAPSRESAQRNASSTTADSPVAPVTVSPAEPVATTIPTMAVSALPEQAQPVIMASVARSATPRSRTSAPPFHPEGPGVQASSPPPAPAPTDPNKMKMEWK